MLTEIQTHNDFLTRKEAERDIADKELASLVARIRKAEAAKTATERAREVANAVLLSTQDSVRSHVEEVVTLALSSVWPGYSFELEYEIKRNQSEATPWIVKNGERFSPREEVGCGVLDIASLGMRLALWSLMDPKPASVFVLDEPARFLSRDKQMEFGSMLRELTRMLGIQVLCITHAEAIIDQSDKAYGIVQSEGVSTAKALE